MGPEGDRRHYKYYDMVLMLATQWAGNADSALEVGCSQPSFVRYLTWPTTRRCVAPYFAVYGDTGRGISEARQGEEFVDNDYMPVHMLAAKFEEWQVPAGMSHDVAICLETIEHVDDPQLFMQKLLATAPTVIVSAPYMWDDTEANCPYCWHKTHNISGSLMEAWAAPFRPNVTTIVDEDPEGPAKGHRFLRRIIMVFQRSRSQSREGFFRSAA